MLYGQTWVCACVGILRVSPSLCFDTWLWKMDLKWSSAAYFMKKRKKILSHRIHTKMSASKSNDCAKEIWTSIDTNAWHARTPPQHTALWWGIIKGPSCMGLADDWEAYFINCVCWAELFKVFFHLFSQSWAEREEWYHTLNIRRLSTFKNSLCFIDHWLSHSFYIRWLFLLIFFFSRCCFVCSEFH